MKRFYTTLVTLMAVITSGYAELELPDGEDFSIGDIIWPGFYVNMAAGGSSEEPGDLAVGHHDPNRDGFTLQGLEASASLRANDHIQGFAAFNLSWGTDEEEWTDEWEEYFGKLTKLPGNLELRGGKLLNRFGSRNAVHQHGWTLVDQNLVNARFLGEDGLATEGGDITWYLPTPFVTALTVSYGDAPSHEHGHGHGEEEEHHDEDEEEEHHADAEEILFEDDFVSANLLIQVNQDDFNQFAFGGSLASGDNGLGDETLIAAANFGYTWRVNGLEPGGRQLSVKTEVMVRDYDAGEHGHEDEHEEEEEEHEEGPGGDSEFGITAEVIHSDGEALDVGVRFGFVEGIDELEIEERYRVSPVLTYYLTEARNALIRFQYNYDELEDSGSAHSGWAQFQYGFGGKKEVR